MRAGWNVAGWLAGLEEIFILVGHRPLRKALAGFSLAMAAAQSCLGSQIASCLDSLAKMTSVQRRWERLLANEHLKVEAIYQAIVTVLAQQRRGGELVLIVDESDRDENLRSLQILAAVKHRCLPLLAVAYAPDHPPMPMNRFLPQQLERLGAWLKGYDLRITLLADRGLSWPVVVRTCRKLGWHYVLRLQGQTRMRRSDGKDLTLQSLLGNRLGIARADDLGVFKKAGRIGPVSVTAKRVKGCKSPWYLLSDTASGEHQVSRYAMRMWCEQTFRDQKSSGLNWRESRVSNPAHATRLLLIITLAIWACMLLGLGIVRRGWRRDLDGHKRRTLSYFKLGLLWLRASFHRHLPPVPLSMEAL